MCNLILILQLNQWLNEISIPEACLVMLFIVIHVLSDLYMTKVPILPRVSQILLCDPELPALICTSRVHQISMTFFQIKINETVTMNVFYVQGI